MNTTLLSRLVIPTSQHKVKAVGLVGPNHHSGLLAQRHAHAAQVDGCNRAPENTTERGVQPPKEAAAEGRSLAQDCGSDPPEPGNLFILPDILH